MKNKPTSSSQPNLDVLKNKQTMTATNKQPTAPWEPLRLTHLKPSFTNQELSLSSRRDLLHKFIIYQASECDPDQLLTSVISTCHPEPLIPINFEIDRTGKGTFIAKCSATAIELFVRQALLIYLQSKNHILKMDIVLGFISENDVSHNPSQLITNLLVNNRWDHQKKILNLENFQFDPKLSMIYCPLSIPSLFIFVIRCLKKRVNPRDNKVSIRELNLKNNKFPGGIFYEKLFNYSLTKLDLRYNNIESIESLRYFSEFKISELWLDGNPLCKSYKTPEEYIHSVKQVFPYVQKLDGVITDVEKKHTIPWTQKFFLLDNTRINLMKQFVKHYFTLFDQNDRIVLNGIYDSDSLFSVTIGNLSNPKHRKLTKLITINRNLIKVVDYSRFHKYLLRGPEEIIGALRKLPGTFHDYRNFSVDILHQDDKQLALIVQGLFYYREYPVALAFNRTFVIKEKADNEYRIVNDQYHIYEVEELSSIVNKNEAKFIANFVPKFQATVLGVNEKDDLLKYLCNLTTMNEEFSRKLLVKYQWDLRAAISAFSKSYSANDVPPEAFRQI